MGNKEGRGGGGGGGGDGDEDNTVIFFSGEAEFYLV